MAAVGEVVRGVFTQHLLTKGVALLVALALWWYVGHELTATGTFGVDVTVTLEDSQLEEWRLLEKPDAKGRVTKRVRVTVEGPRQQIEQLSEEKIPVTGAVMILGQDLAGLMEDEVTRALPLREDQFDVPNRRCRVVTIEPTTLPVKLGRLGSDRMLVRVGTGADLATQYTGTLTDYRVTAVDVSPDRVRVVGPVGALAKLNGVLPLEPIDVTGEESTIYRQARLAAAVREAHIDWARDAEIPTVTVTIEPKPIQKTLQVPIDWKLAPLPEGFAFEEPLTPTLEITVEGPAEEIERITEQDVLLRATMPERLSTSPDGASNNAARLDSFVRPQGFPGVRVLEHRPSMAFLVMPKRAPPPTPPPPSGTGAGTGEKPPGSGGGDTPGKNGAPESGTRGADPDATSGR